MKKFLGLILIIGLIFSTGLFAADASSSSSSASSSGGPEVSDGSVTLVANDVEIKLSREQLDLLGSRTIEAALTTDMAESTTREIVLSEEFDIATVQTLADILEEIAKTGSFDKSVARYVTRKNVLQLLGLLDYLQAELIESIVFERLVELGADLSDCKSAYYFLTNIVQTQAQVIDKAFVSLCTQTFIGHTGVVFSVAWSPDGKSLASASVDTTVRMWNAATGECLQTFIGHHCVAYSVAWSLDGKSLASASEDRTVRVWNVATGEVQTFIGHTSSVYSVAWSPDGKSLASTSLDDTVRIWNAATGECLQTLIGRIGYSSSSVYSVAWSPDGKSLASASSDATVRVWNVATGESKTLTGHTGCVTSVSWSPDGKSLASASDDRTVRVWNIANGEVQILTGHTDLVSSVVWSPDGKRLASASWDKTVRIWNVANGEVQTLTGHTDWIRSVAWSPDGKNLARASDDHTVRIWNNLELDACSPFQKLFILINLPKNPKMFERVSLRAGDDEPIVQWLGVYQSLPEQAKKLLDKNVKEKYENLILSKVLAFGTDRTRKDRVKGVAATTLKTTEESVLRKIGSLMRTNKPASEVLSFFVAHEKEFGDQMQKVQEDIERYAAEQEKERGDGASSSSSSSSSSSTP